MAGKLPFAIVRVAAPHPWRENAQCWRLIDKTTGEPLGEARTRAECRRLARRLMAKQRRAGDAARS